MRRNDEKMTKQRKREVQRALSDEQVARFEKGFRVGSLIDSRLSKVTAL